MAEFILASGVEEELWVIWEHSSFLVAAGQNGSSAVTTGGGVEADKVVVKIGESHILTPCVTTGHDNENGGSGGARTRNLCRDRAAL